LNYTVEPELMTSTPRRIERKRKVDVIGIGCLRLFLLPFILVGIGTFLSCVGVAAFSVVHHETTGRIEGKEVRSDSDDGDHYYVTYTYLVDGRNFETRDRVARVQYDYADRGAAAPVRYAPGMPGFYSMIMLPGGSVGRHIGFLLFFTLFWNGIVSVFVYVAWVAPSIERRLYLHGEIAIGEIVNKRSVKGEDSTTYYVDYEFRDWRGEVLKGKTSLPFEEYATAKEADRLTILYDPNHPNRNVAYRFGGWRAV